MRVCADWAVYISIHAHAKMIIILIRFWGHRTQRKHTETDSWRRAWPATSMLLRPNCLYINIFRRYCSCSWMSSFMYFLMPHSRRVHTYPGSGCEFRGAENSRLSLLIKIYFYSFYFPFEFFPLRCALCTFVSS